MVTLTIIAKFNYVDRTEYFVNGVLLGSGNNTDYILLVVEKDKTLIHVL